jgi:hypothetical protein
MLIVGAGKGLTIINKLFLSKQPFVPIPVRVYDVLKVGEAMGLGMEVFDRAVGGVQK